MPIISLCRLGEWFKVFNDTFCIVHPALSYNFSWPHWYLQPFLSMVFLLYLVGQFYFLEKPEYSEKTIVLSQFTEKMYHINLQMWWDKTGDTDFKLYMWWAKTGDNDFKL
jgi:hypothetical protein